MNTSTFLNSLRVRADVPLVFRAGNESVAPGYHLTEVKAVSYRTMDCGALAHNWTESQFEIWVPKSEKEGESRGHMPANKFLHIVDRVQKDVHLDDTSEARIFASFGNFPASLYTIAGINAENNMLIVDLNPDLARCKSRERREAAATAGSSVGGCGCSSKIEESAEVSCCA